jgi:hypothetical protein
MDRRTSRREDQRYATGPVSDASGMNLWHITFDDMNELEQRHGDAMTVDQKLQLTMIKALLSISQELSKIHHEGIAGIGSTDNDTP